MAAVKTKLGRIACPCCGHSVVLKENEAKTLTIGCDECDVCMFAKPGTQAAASWRAKLPAAPAPVAAPEPTTAENAAAANRQGAAQVKVAGKVPKAPPPPAPPGKTPVVNGSVFSFLGGK